MTIEQHALFTPADAIRAKIAPELGERRASLAKVLGIFSAELIDSGAANRAWQRLDPTLRRRLMPGRTLPDVMPTLYDARDDVSEVGIGFMRPNDKFPVVMPLTQYQGDGEWLSTSPGTAADAALALRQISQLATGEFSGIDLRTMTIPSIPMSLPPAALTISTYLERSV